MFGASLKGNLPKDQAEKGAAQSKGSPRSDAFDDVYFDEYDGLAESQYVFLEGNKLPDAWVNSDKRDFVIAETGFGTGLNFLAAWKLFEETAPKDMRLHFISFEKYPLDAEEVEAILLPWAQDFEEYFLRLKQNYPLLTPGFHRVYCSSRVKLTLIFGDVNNALPRLDANVDAWFLDGFKPSTNPEMWTNVVFENMSRLSHEHTSFATFTAAGAVKRGLRSAGFVVKKVPGYGTKRDMLVGTKEAKVGW